MTDRRDILIGDLEARLIRLLEAAKFFAGRDTWICQATAMAVLDEETRRHNDD